MKFQKINQKLEGDNYWPKLPIVHVNSDPLAETIPEGTIQPKLEQIIRSWKKAVILKITPSDGKALIGFWKNNEDCQYLNVPVETTGTGLFAMRLGPDAVDFFVIPKGHKANYRLEYIETTTLDDPKYEDVPLY